jgi:hypothetical protein
MSCPAGALRIRVYAGVDPVTKRRHDLVEIIPPGPQAEKKARAVRDRLVSQVEERRNPRTNATVDQLLARYLNQFDGAPNTLTLWSPLRPADGRVGGPLGGVDLSAGECPGRNVVAATHDQHPARAGDDRYRHGGRSSGGGSGSAASCTSCESAARAAPATGVVAAVAAGRPADPRSAPATAVRRPSQQGVGRRRCRGPRRSSAVGPRTAGRRAHARMVPQ